MRVAVIGLGGISDAYLQVLGDVAALQLAAVADVDPARRAQVSVAREVPGYSDVDDLLASAKLDAALVLTPPATHEPITVKLLNAGLHVLCE